MSPNRPKSDWTREESRYVDGELDAESCRRLEARVRREPESARHLEAWHDAMDVWRDDTARRAARSDAATIARRVRRDIERPSGSTISGATRRYAVAALVLLGIGLTGSLVLGAPNPRPRGLDVTGVIRAVETHRFDVMGAVAVHELCADLRTDREEEDR